MFPDADYITGLSCSDHAMFCPASRAPELSNFHYGCQFQEKGLDLLLCLEDPHFFKLPGLTPTQLLCNYKIIKWYAILSNIFINIFVDKRQKDQKKSSKLWCQGSFNSWWFKNVKNDIPKYRNTDAQLMNRLLHVHPGWYIFVSSWNPIWFL